MPSDVHANPPGSAVITIPSAGSNPPSAANASKTARCLTDCGDSSVASSDKLMEDTGHVGVAREPAFERDFGQRHGGFCKQLAQVRLHAGPTDAYCIISAT